VAAEAEVRADLLEAVRLELDLAVLLELDLAVLGAVVRLLRAELLEADPLEQDRAVLVEVLAVADRAERLAVLVAAVVVRIPSSIPRMAKFPIRWLLARNPTT